ncbi:hypothetical protein CEXT_493241 [Caerostris extrusa]|uniref:Uncharacterized protein n=1 Tax=Caerostris extrusa TaxID=172846 RepID=A0AAV4XQL4_CAEEX|nr:hypothetical protein CEXT_493241 [Caerostris extrusa]
MSSPALDLHLNGLFPDNTVSIKEITEARENRTSVSSKRGLRKVWASRKITVISLIIIATFLEVVAVTSYWAWFCPVAVCWVEKNR